MQKLSQPRVFLVLCCFFCCNSQNRVATLRKLFSIWLLSSFWSFSVLLLFFSGIYIFFLKLATRLPFSCETRWCRLSVTVPAGHHATSLHMYIHTSRNRADTWEYSAHLQQVVNLPNMMGKMYSKTRCTTGPHGYCNDCRISKHLL